MAREHLQECGIIDENGNLAYPYNGENVRDTDFTRGPGEFYYKEDER